MYFKSDDLFQYFADIEAAGTLPTFAELESAAQALHQAYSNTRALHRAMRDVEMPSKWSHTVPQGTPWQSACAPSTSSTETSSEASNGNGETVFKGDLMLARSIAFMRDALISREAAYAVAEGDVGRLYEMIKVSYILPVT